MEVTRLKELAPTTTSVPASLHVPGAGMRRVGGWLECLWVGDMEVWGPEERGQEGGPSWGAVSDDDGRPSLWL